MSTAPKHDTLTAGSVQSLSYIPEGDVFRLITHSKLPAAERFERWVFDEMLNTQNAEKEQIPSEIQIFNYNNNAVRTVQKDGEPWFVLKDVCAVLDIGNSRMAADRLDDDEKGVSQIDTPGGMGVTNRYTLPQKGGMKPPPT